MASKCIRDCVNIKNNIVCVPTGKTYANLHKWPVAEAEFIRSISRGNQNRTTLIDSISCRQMYLRSYTFSREEGNKDERECKNGNNVDVRINKGGCFGGKKKASKIGMRTSKTTSSHRAFIVRILLKCLSCSSSIKVNVEE
ncbi:unnamed protein product [Cochlearia groenlandica]